MAGYEIDDPEIKAVLVALGDRLKTIIPKGWGFTLFLMSHGAGGATFYLSSTERESTIKALKEWIVKAEADVAAAKKGVH